MRRHKIAVILGTRPEAIKLAPVIRVLQQHAQRFETVVVSTGQHREMLDQVLRLAAILPDIELNLMQPDQSLSGLTSRALQAVDALLEATRPELVMVQGDTTTVFAAALAAFNRRVPVAHVEAGLRSHDVRNPFPEEVNRRFTGALSELHFAPTEGARANLLAEGIAPEKIVVTGNTAIDMLLWCLQLPFSFSSSSLAGLPMDGGPLLLLTSHRRESWGPDLENICLAMSDLACKFPGLQVVYPVHMNPNVRQTVDKLLNGVERVHLLPPLDYLTFVNLMRRAYLVLTDSGGVQEEAPSLRKPVLVLRKLTERPEASAHGMAKVIGTTRHEIFAEASRLLNEDDEYQAMTLGENPYGDGKAAERIVAALHRWADGKTPLLEAHQEFQAPAARDRRVAAGSL